VSSGFFLSASDKKKRGFSLTLTPFLSRATENKPKGNGNSPCTLTKRKNLDPGRSGSWGNLSRKNEEEKMSHKDSLLLLCFLGVVLRALTNLESMLTRLLRSSQDGTPF